MADELNKNQNLGAEDCVRASIEDDGKLASAISYPRTAERSPITDKTEPVTDLEVLPKKKRVKSEKKEKIIKAEKSSSVAMVTSCGETCENGKKKKGSFKRSLGRAIIFIPYAFAVGAVWLVTVVLVIAALSCFVSGIAGCIISLPSMTVSGSVGLAQFGVSIAIIGVGLMLMALAVKAVKSSAKFTISNMYVTKEKILKIEETQNQ